MTTGQILHTYKTDEGDLIATLEGTADVLLTSATDGEKFARIAGDDPASKLAEFGLDPVPVVNAIGRNAIARSKSNALAMDARESLAMALSEKDISYAMHVEDRSLVVVELSAEDADRLTSILRAAKGVR